MRLSPARFLLVAAVVAPILAACTAPPAAHWVEPGLSSAAPTPIPPPTITLTFGGDVHFTGRTLQLLDDPASAFGPVSEILQSADVAMVNLETAVTTRGAAEPKRFHFRAPEGAYTALAQAGIDVVSVANNHALDYGQVGLADTLDFAEEARVPVVGAGDDISAAYAAWITTVHNVKIAFVGLSQVAELSASWAAREDRPGLAYAFNLERSVRAVRAAKKSADVVVLYLHWGLEYHECPTAAMKTFARRMADAGATLIVGTHAHNLLGDGWVGQTFVQYGLGNFLWWYNDAGSNDTGVLRVTLSAATIVKTEFIPAYIDRTTGQPIPSKGQQRDRMAKKYATLRRCTGLASGPGRSR